MQGKEECNKTMERTKGIDKYMYKEKDKVTKTYFISEEGVVMWEVTAADDSNPSVEYSCYVASSQPNITKRLGAAFSLSLNHINVSNINVYSIQCIN